MKSTFLRSTPTAPERLRRATEATWGKLPEAAPPDTSFVASDWRALEPNTLKGFFSLTLPSGLVLRECTYH